jgi:glyoxylase-like metal-dependent hydrolase (beta-lactamase superfamily II)
MDFNLFSKQPTRRELLRAGSAMVGGGLVAGLMPNPARAAHVSTAPLQQSGAGGTDRVAQMRAQGSAVPLQMQKLRDNMYMLSGPGGNMAVLDGPDGKVLVDSSYSPVAPKILADLSGISNTPFKFLINTHWHIDHTDGNAAMHEAGAFIFAHENTRKRLSTSQDILAFGAHFDPAPVAAWPQQTFTDNMSLYLDGEAIHLGYMPPAHTDTDIYVHYPHNNVLHMGDIFFNGMYPFIDAGTKGNISGMINGADKGIELADKDTIVIPGHGPVSDKATLTKYRDMLAAVRDRVRTQKATGKSLQDVKASKPTAEFDATYGKGMIQPDAFVAEVYSTL